MEKPRWSSDSAEIHRVTPSPCSAPSRPPAIPRKDRKIGPAYGLDAPPRPPAVSVSDTRDSNPAQARDPRNERDNHRGTAERRQMGRVPAELERRVEELQRRLLRERAVVQHERGPRKQRANDEKYGSGRGQQSSERPEGLGKL